MWSRVRTCVDFNHRAKQFEVACLVVQKSKLDFDLCFSNDNMLEKYVLVLLYSFLDSWQFIDTDSYSGEPRYCSAKKLSYQI